MPESLRLALTPENLPTFAFVATRVGGLMVAAPLWSMKSLPRRFRAGLTVVLTLMLLPGMPAAKVADSLVLLPLGLVTEFLIGLVVGLTAAVLVYGVALAGEMLTHQMGLNLGAEASPLSGVSVPGIGELKMYLALMIYVGVNGHLMLLRGLADSFAAIPPGGPVSVAGWPSVATHLLGATYRSAVQAAAPAMVALILVDLAIGITSRVVPQLNAIMVLFPLSIGLGLLMVGASLPVVSASIFHWMSALPETVAYVLGGFTGTP